jgi:hypothetical protein
MTLEQYAYLAEIIGVVLVIASLAYVALQLRQNTAAMRASNEMTWIFAYDGCFVIPFLQHPAGTRPSINP